MPPLQTSTLGRACRLFLEGAYPAGPDSIPPAILRFWSIEDADPLAGYLAEPTCQIHGERGFSLRLGSAGYAHLKLKVQCMADKGGDAWLFAVDTHDAFSREVRQPPTDHPDAPAWHALQNANRALKERIEASWEAAGLLTLNALLRGALGAQV
jgi:hypothetical protein